MTPTSTAADASIDWQARPTELRTAVQAGTVKSRDRRVAALKAEVAMLNVQLDWFRRLAHTNRFKNKHPQPPDRTEPLFQFPGVACRMHSRKVVRPRARILTERRATLAIECQQKKGEPT